MREADARPVGVAVVLHDVTRFRLLDDAKTNLVATVSHELKTPLTSVRMVLAPVAGKKPRPDQREAGGIARTPPGRIPNGCCRCWMPCSTSPGSKRGLPR